MQQPARVVDGGEFVFLTRLHRHALGRDALETDEPLAHIFGVDFAGAALLLAGALDLHEADGADVEPGLALVFAGPFLQERAVGERRVQRRAPVGAALVKQI